MGFFDELGKKAVQTVQGAKDKGVKFSNEMKLKSKVSEKEDKISLLYIEMGKEIYSNFTRDIDEDTESIKSKCQEIRKLNEEINELNKEILALKDIKICVSCGAQVSVNSEFCPKCGVKQVTVVSEEIKNGAKETEVVQVNNTEIIDSESSDNKVIDNNKLDSELSYNSKTNDDTIINNEIVDNQEDD